MDDLLARLKAANTGIGERDAELREELRERREFASVTQEGTGQAEVLLAGEPVSQTELAQETIVRRTGRPVLAIVRNEVVVPGDDEARVWRARLQAATTQLARAIRAVGRIEVAGHPLSWLGTGWLVEPDVIVTNRHVADAFARRSGSDFVFRQGISGVSMSASIDFLEEIGRTESLLFRLEKVLHIEDDDGPDLAFLRVAPAAGQAPAAPIPLAGGAPLPDEAVAVIGYPARDSRIPDVELMDRIFGNVYDKKRLAPGQVMRVDGRRLQHDCSTLGGNSGSAVVSLSSGSALGIHFAGTFLTANVAVPSALIAERLAAVHRPRPRLSPAFPTELQKKEDAPPSSAAPGAAVPGSAATLTFNLPVSVTLQIGQPVVGQPAATSPAAGVAKPRRSEAPARVPLPAAARPIEWPPDIFSLALNEALTLHDYNRAEALVATFARHAKTQPYPYAARRANRDLDMLRRKRQFALMRRYAEAVLGSGTSDARVRRQYGQALIELGAFDAARRVLQPVARDSAANRVEAAEAQGLIGRSFKQQYVDAPGAPGADERLRQAVAAYRAVYDRDATRLWHGINVASCTLRGVQDGRAWADRTYASAVAQSVLDRLERGDERASGGERRLDVWDHATRVEALLVLSRQADAEQAVDSYLAHPDLDAFEVTSTHRQLTQLLQLEAAHPVVRRLWEGVERYRAGGVTWRMTDVAGTAAPAGQTPSSGSRPDTMPVLVRVSDPAWAPTDVPGLQVRGRLGTVIAANATRASLDALLHDPSVVSVEASRPVAGGECNVSVPFIQALGPYPGPDGPYHERGDRALIAVIDNGIDVLHEAFLDQAGQSRIVGIWDQRPSNPSGPPPEGFDFGTFHSREAIAGYIREKAVPPQLGRNAKGHGTHVASIAAGRKTDQQFHGGVAPEALLLVVISATRDPIGYSTTHVAALDFIDRMATRLGLPVVVNVSQGMNAGAHDGKSALEVAFDEFSKGGRRPGRVIVKSAGNERNKNGHALVTIAEGFQEQLSWTRPHDTVWPRERIELWWSAANELEFQLLDPSGSASAWVSEAHPSVASTFASGNPYRLTLVKRHIDNGDSQLVVEIGDGVAPGPWRLAIMGRRVPAEGTVHAWLERIDDVPSSFSRHASEEMTLSIPGTAQNVITVGAVAMDPMAVGDFSSYGPTRDRREKPDVAAPGIGIKAACGNTLGDIVEMQGTSMAAPHVAGAIALVFSRAMKSGSVAPTATQIASALRQKTRNYTSRWDRGQGYGIVDVAKLLAAF